jgi:hypothetical protein
MSGDILMLAIMEKYGWDYHTYIKQPYFIIDLIVQKMVIDASKAKNNQNIK